MALDAIIRSAVATANSITGSLQATVSHAPWTGNGTDGMGAWGTAVSRQALVEFKQEERQLPTGESVAQRAIVTFIHPIEPNGAAQRREPIDPRDQITLPNGYTGPILNIEGIVDPSTSAPYMLVVALG